MAGRQFHQSGGRALLTIVQQTSITAGWCSMIAGPHGRPPGQPLIVGCVHESDPDTSAALHQGRVLDRHRGSVRKPPAEYPASGRRPGTFCCCSRREEQCVPISWRSLHIPGCARTGRTRSCKYNHMPVWCRGRHEPPHDLAFQRCCNAPPALFQRPGAAGWPRPPRRRHRARSFEDTSSRGFRCPGQFRCQ